MHISVREVVSGRFSWAYRQQRWNLDVGELVESKLTAHIEFDWQAGGCWMLAQGQPQEFQFSGSSGSPTADELRLQLSPGACIEMSLLLG